MKHTINIIDTWTHNGNVGGDLLIALVCANNQYSNVNEYRLYKIHLIIHPKPGMYRDYGCSK